MLQTYKLVHPAVGTSEESAAGIAHIATLHGEALAALKALKPRNREAMTNTTHPQLYYCLGCDVPDGNLRAEIIAFGGCPLYQLAAQQLLSSKLALQCYFPECYEEKAGPGPGAVIGYLPGHLLNKLDTSAGRAFKMWHWVDANEPGYLSEHDARKGLWQLAQDRFMDGLTWLERQGNALPGTALRFPSELRHSLHGLLGVPAMQKLVHEHFKQDVVLLDANHVVLRRDLSWSMLTAA